MSDPVPTLSPAGIVVLILAVAGMAVIFVAGMIAMAILGGAPLPPAPPVPAPALSLTVPKDIKLGEQFVVTSNSVAPVVWAQHGMKGMRGHIGQETQGADKRYVGSYAVTIHQKGVFPLGAFSTDQSKNQTQSWQIIDTTDPVPSPSPTPGPPVPPSPPPAPIATPLMIALQAAYALDTDSNKAASVASLSQLIVSIVPIAKASGQVTKAADFQASLHSAATLAIGATAIPKTRAAVGAYISSQLPTSPSWPVDAAYWDSATNACNALTEAFKGVK